MVVYKSLSIYKLIFLVLRIKPRALSVLGKRSTTELQPKAQSKSFICFHYSYTF